MTAASYGLEFVDEPPALMRPATTGRKDRPLRVVPEPSSWVAPDSHRPHGSYAKYTVELCRCEPCRRAKRDYERARQRAIRRPDQVWAPYVPAGAARRHVRELAAAGVGLKQLAKVSGLPHGLLSKLVYGDRARGMASSRRIRRETHEAIMAVRPSDFAGGTRLDAGPTWALLEELLAAGYTRTWIASQLAGRSTPALQLSRHSVSGRNVRAVAELYAEFRSLPAPPRRTRWTR